MPCTTSYVYVASVPPLTSSHLDDMHLYLNLFAHCDCDWFAEQDHVSNCCNISAIKWTENSYPSTSPLYASLQKLLHDKHVYTYVSAFRYFQNLYKKASRKHSMTGNKESKDCADDTAVTQFGGVLQRVAGTLMQKLAVLMAELTPIAHLWHRWPYCLQNKSKNKLLHHCF